MAALQPPAGYHRISRNPLGRDGVPPPSTPQPPVVARGACCAHKDVHSLQTVDFGARGVGDCLAPQFANCETSLTTRHLAPLAVGRNNCGSPVVGPARQAGRVNWESRHPGDASTKPSLCFRCWEVRSFGDWEKNSKKAPKLKVSPPPSSESNTCQFAVEGFCNWLANQIASRQITTAEPPSKGPVPSDSPHTNGVRPLGRSYTTSGTQF